jgi:hypothetical protein
VQSSVTRIAAVSPDPVEVVQGAEAVVVVDVAAAVVV